uniref:Cytosolic class I small heat shock protein HSP18.0Ie n=1 Tax=Phlegmariurus fordii TaxID=89711 RepID=A0A8J9QUD3_9TRAC|nr:cytosolic class I small heat shock protein HSP18.0Ie [Phlegmariurus fordii]
MALSPFFIGQDQSIFDPFDNLWEPFQRLGVWNNPATRQFAQDASAVAGTRIDWLETPEAHIFKADLPGLKKEEIKVQVEDGRSLQISGERKKEEVEKTDKWHRVERSQGSFLRRFRLPENANVEEVKAKVEDGVLTVTVPKRDQKTKTSEVKDVDISG